ncbi:RHS repeat domain-containing protein [Gibbsiella quercinecans]|uniref:RHS repeat domain-containing protein n=1 Tax=Gibbsiella quercinecans TaxID=929813 RepID=UPI000EF163FC|nr:hypothetical protein BIY31_22930 [Gibbsiella quercinecans]
MTALLNPNHDRWQFDYDNGDRLLAQTDYAGRRTQYGYDRLGQLIQIIECSLAAGSELTAPLHMRLAYDAPGRITLRRATGEREHAFLFERRYLWDRQDQLVQQMFTEDGIGQPGRSACKAASAMMHAGSSPTVSSHIRKNVSITTPPATAPTVHRPRSGTTCCNAWSAFAGRCA